MNAYTEISSKLIRIQKLTETRCLAEALPTTQLNKIKSLPRTVEFDLCGHHLFRNDRSYTVILQTTEFEAILNTCLSWVKNPLDNICASIRNVRALG